jgi:hypothetical protein
MDIEFEGDVEPADGGTRLTITMELLPKGLFRLFGPMIRRSFQKKKEKNLANIRAALEQSRDAIHRALRPVALLIPSTDRQRLLREASWVATAM